MEFFKSRRHDYFPWIKDFSDPIDHLRNKEPKDLSWGEWFWFHPSAYNLINISIPFCAAFNFLLFTLIFNTSKLINTMCYVIIFVMLYYGYKKLKLYTHTKNISFYDIFIRDYR